MNKIKNFIKSRLINLLSKNKYIENISKYLYINIRCRPVKFYSQNKNAKKILISYINEPFRKEKDNVYINQHQNRKETLIMRSVFEDLNLSSEFHYFESTKVSNKNQDIIFGIEPFFITASKLNPTALKIYYATGSYFEHQNNSIKKRTDQFNKEHNSDLKYQRILTPHNACEIADYIIQIGSKYTLETYPENIRNKIIIIRQACHTFNFENFLEKKLNQINKNEFIWMGSKGSILKGFDIVLEYFLKNPQYKINIIGYIDADVYKFYKKSIDKSPNIILHGFLDLNSSKLEEIALKSSFVIMPSISEGCPGSVINMMKLGCVPLVTKNSAFDGIDELGYIIKDYNMESLSEAIDHYSNLTNSQLKDKIIKVTKFANSNFNEKIFYLDLKNAIEKIIKEKYGK